MRIALVSPYSWSYPGGVLRHIEALAGRLMAEGHDVRVLAPYDPDDRITAALHRGARPQVRELPDWVVPMGRSIGMPFNGAMSNVSLTPTGASVLRTELQTGGYDVVHLHDPVALATSWDTLAVARGPLVVTFHTFGENPLTHGLATVIGARRRMRRINVRIAVSEAAEWTGRRFFGGRYRIIPNGVDVPAEPAAPPHDTGRLRIAFVGQAVERKGLPVLLRAFEALRDHVPADLRLMGTEDDEVAPLLHDRRGVAALGRLDDEEKARELAAADVLCAPSLGGESFGMVLTEAFAQGTPAVASDIAGYRDVIEDGRSGVLVPRGDATALAEALRDLWHEPERRAALARGARARAERFAWPQVTAEILEAYEDARAVHAAQPQRGELRKAADRLRGASADGGPKVPARRMPSPEPPRPGRAHPAFTLLRRGGFALAMVAALVLAWHAIGAIGWKNIASSLLSSSPAWVLAGVGLMGLAMAVRAVSWYAILRAALPGAQVRLTDALQGTFIGVLMSATLPARLGEPSRALVVARRTGRARDNLPAVLGSIVSQTVLNVVALVVLGAVTISTIDLFSGRGHVLLLISIVPLVALLAVAVAPALLRRGGFPQTRQALARVRSGLAVFRRPRLGAVAVTAQLLAWAIQWLACYVLLVALGLGGQAGVGAAAAVLFAVNVTAVIPATPANLGVFQAACVAVLHVGYGVHTADALGYGIVLQAVEIATAVVMGTPALLKEGLSWRDVRLRAVHASPVRLAPRPGGRPLPAGPGESAAR